jgi:hypothetical protein
MLLERKDTIAPASPSCIHSFGVGNIRGTMVPPVVARGTLLGRQRKRGRKPRAAGAWMYQAYDIRSPARHPLQDPAVLAGHVPMVADALVGVAPAIVAGDVPMLANAPVVENVIPDGI